MFTRDYILGSRQSVLVCIFKKTPQTDSFLIINIDIVPMNSMMRSIKTKI